MNQKAVLALFFISRIHLAFGQSFVPEQFNAKEMVKPVVSIKAFAFNLSEVELLDSPFKAAMTADTQYLLTLSPDRLLSQFRTHAGLKPKAQVYGGWESSGLAGHTLGHYLSACAMQYAVSRDTSYLHRVNYIVKELSACQQARKTGYVGAIPKEDSVFMEISQGNIRSRGFDLNGAWSPWYTVHKVMAGLLDAYLYCNNLEALKIERGMADWSGQILQNLSDEQIQKMLLCEYGGMNEVLVNTYAFTADKKYLDLSYKFHDKKVLDSLAIGFDVLPGKHSNTQVPKVIGTARRYELTGTSSDLAISEFFWKTVVTHHTYAPGGNSNYEYLGKQDALGEKLTDNTMETCNTYNMLKLTRHLFGINPSSGYMDFYERALYNHILASQNHQDGMMCYFVPLRMGTRKRFSDPDHTFTCCVGSGIENHVKYGESIYYHSHDGGLYINLFIPSILTWKEKGITVRLTSNLPLDKNVLIKISSKKSNLFPMHIRKPGWLQQDAQVKINGELIKAIADSEGYFVINRKWKDGDIVEFTVPSDLHVMAMPDVPSRQAFFYGPVLLAGNLGAQEPDPLKGISTLVTDKQEVREWIKQDSSDPLIFNTSGTGTPEDIKLQPFYAIQNDYYSVYWDVFTTRSWNEQQKIYEAKRKAAYDLERETADIFRPGEMQPERDHNFAGEKTESGESHTHKFRVARGGGYFSFDMKVVPDFSYVLIVTYWGMDNRGRVFDILADGEKIVTEDLNKYKESRFYDISYRLPSSLVKGKKNLSIKFQAKPNNNAGPVYGVRLVKEANLEGNK